MWHASHYAINMCHMYSVRSVCLCANNTVSDVCFYTMRVSTEVTWCVKHEEDVVSNQSILIILLLRHPSLMGGELGGACQHPVDTWGCNGQEIVNRVICICNAWPKTGIKIADTFTNETFLGALLGGVAPSERRVKNPKCSWELGAMGGGGNIFGHFSLSQELFALERQFFSHSAQCTVSRSPWLLSITTTWLMQLSATQSTLWAH